VAHGRDRRLRRLLPLVLLALLAAAPVAAEPLVGAGTLRRLGWTLAVAAALALAAYAAGFVDRSGAAAGALVAAAALGGLGWPGLALLAAFVVLAGALTRLGYARKAARGLAQGGGGRRSARHVLANGAVAAATALLAALAPGPGPLRLAFAGALAAALSDTAASETGQLWGRRTVLLTTLRPVPAGTDGAVSAPGSAAGLAAALLLAALGAATRLYPWPQALAVAAGGVIGNLADSLVGATLERRGLLGNETTNLLCTAAGALAAAALAGL
jgi:uncharacterized protein (TIGR00297 family)